ncbi:DUF1294 domain-containing protein [Gudongella sp. SC589]|uniref:DUF1294 domain-containing protein n=1 Tax=Gudongella sp. SC589 TaxID=3385990 RepID=UPI003904BD2B
MLDQYLIYTVIIYMIFINLVSLLLFRTDKQLARKGKRRIAEKTLFLSAILGGGPGAVLGMHLFSHKTKKAAFQLGLPLIAIVNVVLVMMVLKDLV